MADTGMTGASAPAETSAVETPAAEEIPAWRKVKHKVKADGRELDVDYDELVKGYQTAQSAQRRFQEAARLRKDIEEDPDSYFKNILKKDPEQWAEEKLLKKLKLQNMTPEQKALYEKEQLLVQKEKEADELRQQQQAYITEQIVKDLDRDITDAFKAIGEEPDELTIKRMADIMDAHFTETQQMLPAARALKIARQRDDDYVWKRLEKFDAKTLREKLPKKILDELRKADLDLVRSQFPTKSNATKPAPAQATARQAKAKSTDDFFKTLEANLR